MKTIYLLKVKLILFSHIFPIQFFFISEKQHRKAKFALGFVLKLKENKCILQ